ncbi:MAG: fatty acid desaturase [Planctomycetaceae bacterium]
MATLDGSGVALNIAEESRPIQFLFRLCRFPLMWAAIAMIVTGYPTEHIALRVVLIGWITYWLFTYTSMFHEAVHLLLPGGKAGNLIAGQIVGTFLCVPYHCYKEAHVRHHAYLNRPNDWELWPYSSPDCSLGFRRVFVWLDLLFGFLTAPYVYGRIFFHRDTPIKDSKIRLYVWMEYGLILAFWGTIFGVVGYYGRWESLILAWGIPHWLAGIMQVGRKLTEHLGMASFDPLKGTRTVVGQNWLSRLCSFLNYDIFVHGPHHRYPRMKSGKLESKMAEHVTRDEGIKFPLFKSYTGAVMSMLPHMFKQPGVGLNAGASVVNEVKVDDVSDFVEDAKTLVEDWH